METTLPIRASARLERHVSLPAGPATPGAARGEVRAAICAWDVPVDLSTALLLTSELVTNAVSHTAGGTVLLAITCGWGRLRVEVHDESRSVPVVGAAPASAESGRGLVLVAGLSSDWGYYQTQAGKAVYFTLGFHAGL